MKIFLLFMFYIIMLSYSIEDYGADSLYPKLITIIFFIIILLYSFDIRLNNMIKFKGTGRKRHKHKKRNKSHAI